jgi:hypothetical protein
MRLWLVFIVLFFRNTTSSGTKIDHEVERHLQSTPQTTYRANYSADFQHFHEVQCGGDPPVLLVGCKGSSMTILNTSDTRIACALSQEYRLFNVTSSTAYECTMNCSSSDTDCQSIYTFETGLFDPIQGPFGSIFFQCEGSTVDEVDAAFVYRGDPTDTTNGYCGASSSDTAAGRNYHIGKLGVSCPVADGSGGREYVYDDTYVDCISAGSFTIDLAPINETDVFACVSGMKCGGLECKFSFLDFWIEASITNFFDTCVNPQSVLPSFEFTAQFEASWATVYDPFNSSSSCGYSQDDAVAVISCDVDASIRFVNSTAVDSNSCLQSKLSEILCYTNENKIVNNLVSVFYVSAWCPT